MYFVDGLQGLGSNAAAFCPPMPPVVTDAADSSMGAVTGGVTLLRATLAPPPASVGPAGTDKTGRSGDPGYEIGALARLIYIATPALGFCRQVAIRNHNDLPVPAIAANSAAQTQAAVASRRARFLGRRQVAWPRAFQRFPPINPPQG